MSKSIQRFAFTFSIVALSSLDMTSVQAKQQCRAAMPEHPHGQWWSYRLIDGRKCWYAGKPMLSKSLLEWRSAVSREPGSREEATGAVAKLPKPGNPLDAQASARSDLDTFEARWRDRISLVQQAARTLADPRD
jgi:hypothetical protein